MSLGSRKGTGDFRIGRQEAGVRQWYLLRSQGYPFHIALPLCFLEQVGFVLFDIFRVMLVCTGRGIAMFCDMFVIFRCLCNAVYYVG